MRELRTAKSKSSASTGKALLLAFVLIVGFLIYSKLTKAGLPMGLSSFVEGSLEDMRKVAEFDKDRKAILQRQFAGFWAFEEDSISPYVSKSDHLELKDNGIIWQVVQWSVALPGGDTARFSQALNAYLNPYGFLDSTSQTYICEVRTLRQAFIVGDDTCYGDSHVDELWEASRQGTTLRLNGRFYEPYGDDIRKFFPEDMIDIIDKLLPNQCPVRSTLPTFAKTALEKALQNQPEMGGPDPVSAILDLYYFPIVVDEILRLHLKSRQDIPEKLTFRFTLGSDGKIVDEPSLSGNVLSTKFESALLRDMKSWSFAKVARQRTPLKISHTFSLPAKKTLVAERH